MRNKSLHHELRVDKLTTDTRNKILRGYKPVTDGTLSTKNNNLSFVVLKRIK